MTKIEWYLMATIAALVLLNAIAPAKGWVIDLITRCAA